MKTTLLVFAVIVFSSTRVIAAKAADTLVLELNPAQTALRVHDSHTEEVYCVYDIHEQLLLFKRAEEKVTTINVQKLPVGLYCVKEIKTKKIAVFIKTFQ
jgi:hypothetical protein